MDGTRPPHPAPADTPEAPAPQEAAQGPLRGRRRQTFATGPRDEAAITAGDVGEAIGYGALEAVDQVREWIHDRGTQEGRLDLTERFELDEPTHGSMKMLAGFSQFAAGTLPTFLPGPHQVITAGVRAVQWGGRALAAVRGGATAAKVGKVATGGPGFVLRGAFSDYAAHDPEVGSMLVMLNDNPQLEPYVNDWIGSRNPDDPEHYNRLKNAVEGAILGGVLGGTIHVGAKGAKGVAAMAEQVAARVHGSVKAMRAGRPGAAAEGADGVRLKAEANRAAAESVVTTGERLAAMADEESDLYAAAVPAQAVGSAATACAGGRGGEAPAHRRHEGHQDDGRGSPARPGRRGSEAGGVRCGKRHGSHARAGGGGDSGGSSGRGHHRVVDRRD